MSKSLHEPSLHSREKTNSKTQQTDQKKKKNNSKPDETDETPMVLDEDNKDGNVVPKKRNGFSYYPLLTYKRNIDKTFYYKYFRPYPYYYRRLRMEEDCQCPKGKIHNTKCTWYHPDTIYILDTQGDISASEEAAQQKIYHMY